MDYFPFPGAFSLPAEGAELRNHDNSIPPPGTERESIVLIALPGDLFLENVRKRQAQNTLNLADFHL